jgi:DNA-binding transcriptional regulator LsrR (DeoR family)
MLDRPASPRTRLSTDRLALTSVSQSRVPRFLKEAAQDDIVRTEVVAPSGVHTDLEDELRLAFGAAYLETTLTGSDRIGISSWSATLLATAEAIRPTVSTATGIAQVIIDEPVIIEAPATTPTVGRVQA